MSDARHIVKSDQRKRMLLARLRGRQLDLARQGRVADSARIAGRVGRVRRLVGPASPAPPVAA